MRKLLLATAALLLPLTANAAVFNPAVKTLDNGLEVVVVENHRAPVVLHMMWYHVGSADEEPAEAGLAHYLEHMMFKGTKQHPEQDFSATVAGLGGEDNAFTSYDYTAYFQKVPPAQLATVMAMEAERMTGLQINEVKFDTEKSVIQQERGERNESTPESKFALKLQEALHRGHPYARPVIGTQSSIASLTRDQLYTFYTKHYMPGNATLVVVGDVKADDVFAKAEATYGAIPAQPLPKRERIQPKKLEPQRLTVVEKNVRQPLMALAWRAPNYKNPHTINPYAFDVLADILNMPDSYLQQELIYRSDIAVGVSADYDGDKFDEGDFTISLSPRPTTSLDKAEAALETAIALLQKKTISAERIEAAKKRMIESADLARDQLASPAYSFGMARATGETIEAVENWPTAIQNVTPQDVNAALQALKNPADVTAKLAGQKGKK